MEISKTGNFCDPCRCRKNKRLHDIYNEKEPRQVSFNVQEKPRRLRPSSANSIKSSPDRKKSKLYNYSKLTSSDSKIPKKNQLNKSKNHSPKIDPETTKQLKNDLETIKQQLITLTEKKNEALNVTNQLESHYNDLQNKCNHQQTEIQKLQNENKILIEKLKDYQLQGSQNLEITKLNLDEYEKKLNLLYKEFVEASEIMEHNRNKLCNCINNKNTEFNNLINKNVELTEIIDHSKNEYQQLLDNYQKLKNNESHYLKQNQELNQTLQNLKSQLYKTKHDLELSVETAKTSNIKHQKELETQKQCYCSKLESQTQEINDLNNTIEQLQIVCSCKTKTTDTNDTLEYEQLEMKYKYLVEKLHKLQDNHKKKNEELLNSKKYEANITTELAKLQSFYDKLLNVANEQNTIITDLNRLIQKKDNLIYCQKKELASKVKQVDLLLKNEARLKERVIELQEDIVSLNILQSQKPDLKGDENVLCAEDCPIHLTDELEDLITALYEEINKTAVKDEEIEKLRKQICCLQCSLESKENELICLKKKLKTCHTCTQIKHLSITEV